MRSETDDIVIVHSSDLHVDDGYTMRAWGGDGTAPLAAVLESALAARADLVLLTGDVFEHNRLADDILVRTRTLLECAAMPVVLLPGNHDPLTDDSVWYRGRLVGIPGVHVLGAGRDFALFPDLDLAVWGRAHTDYDDMVPLARPPQRAARRHIVAGHGHFVERRPEAGRHGPAWLITPEEIEATEADYVALGHWNTHTSVGGGRVPACYSGSPDYAETVNVVRLTAGGTEISRSPVAGTPANAETANGESGA
ncbi:MAG: metallophosphoesterase [Rhodospirillaceae bacterium]